MTEQQIKWAASHDWYIGRADTAGTVLVNERYTMAGKLYEEIKVFADFRALKDWAGY
jgi:hypothetical protein